MQSDEEVFRGTMHTAHVIALLHGTRQCPGIGGVVGIVGGGS